MTIRMRGREILITQYIDFLSDVQEIYHDKSCILRTQRVQQINHLIQQKQTIAQGYETNFCLCIFSFPNKIQY